MAYAQIIGMSLSRRAHWPKGQLDLAGTQSEDASIRPSVKGEPMSARYRHARVTPDAGCRVLLAAAGALLVCACQPEADSAAPQARPVRALTVERRQAAVPVTL